MTAAAAPVPDLDQLPWQAQGEYQVVTDGTCLYMREGKGSMISGVVFAVVIALAAGGDGGWLLLRQNEGSAKLFGGLMLSWPPYSHA